MGLSYRVFGSENSPYSIKVRSYFRYKGFDHAWVVRDQSQMEEFSKYAKLPLVPLVVDSDGQAIQDSTPIMEKLEAANPEPPFQPADEALAFISALLEEYGDEWGNKHMFHYRWTYEPDQWACADRLVREMAPGMSDEDYKGMATAIRDRMVPRLSFVGSNEVTREQIEGSFLRFCELLEAHLDGRPFVLGTRPAMADFGLYAQVYEALVDPTPGAILTERFPRVVAWVERMLDPPDQGDYEDWTTLESTLCPILAQEVGGLFLPWTTANAEALASGAEEFSVELEGRPFGQQTQKYHAKSLAALKARYQAVADRTALDSILKATGCLNWLAG